MAKRLPLIFILTTVMLDAMGVGLIMPVMPDLIQEVGGVSLADAAKWGGILAASFAAMQFIFSPILGNLSDRFGRRPVLLVSLLVMTLDYVVMALAGSIWWLLAGRIVGGITAATHATASAYIADITPRESRAQSFGLLAAAFGIGFVLGPLLGGLLGNIDPRAPFIAAAIFAGANFLLGLVALPETLTPEKRRPFDWRRANPLGGLMQIGKLPGLGPLLIVYVFYTIGNYVYASVWSYYTQAAFAWDSVTIGYSLALYGISTVVVQGWLIRVVMPWLGEMKSVVIGLMIDLVVLTIFGLAGQGWMIWLFTPIAAIGSIATPALTAIMSQQASEEQQGELQGVLGSIGAVSMTIAPIMMTQTFFWFNQEGASSTLPGAPFLLAAILLAMSIFVLWVGVLRGRRASAC